ncbi:MAG TPA: AAC(3) family N-acetyltransferase [Anaerolineae bacterium]|nr:AAC(3) family N-acetyltransferase [Anaerolineae bacterium]
MSDSNVGVRDIVRGLREIGLTQDSRVIVHASLSSFGPVRGGAVAVLAGLLSTCDTVVMPAFTYQALVWPLTGPPDNGVSYGQADHVESNRNAIFFHLRLPIHRDVGVIPERLRQHPATLRSAHPALSFVAVGSQAQAALAGQTLDQPLAPIEWLQHHDGDVLLIGVGHTRNTSIHFAEKLANRKQFVRWAIIRDGDSVTVRAVRLPNFPGCSDGFDAIEPEIASKTTQVTIGNALVRRVPLRMLIPIVVGWISDEPEALLCTRPGCERCNAVRHAGRPG